MKLLTCISYSPFAIKYPGFEEHSGTPNDKESFSLLLDEVRAQLDQLGAETGRFYGLTAALPCGPQHITNMDVAHVAATLSHLSE
jgi:chitinase